MTRCPRIEPGALMCIKNEVIEPVPPVPNRLMAYIYLDPADPPCVSLIYVNEFFPHLGTVFKVPPVSLHIGGRDA